MTNSHKELRQLGHDDLSAKPGEESAEWLARVRELAVIEPEFLIAEQRRLDADTARRQELTQRSRQRAGMARTWQYASLIALASWLLLFFLTGLTGWVAMACVIALAAAGTARRLAKRTERSGLARSAPGPSPGVDHAVHIADLDDGSRESLDRTQRAIDQILSAGTRGEAELMRLADEATLRRQEWMIAQHLRNITTMRARLNARPESGPHLAAVLRRHREDLATAQEATAAMIKALEQYSGKVRRGDADRADRRNADEARLMDGDYTDLAAATGAFEHAIAELRTLTDLEPAAEAADRDAADQPGGR